MQSMLRIQKTTKFSKLLKIVWYFCIIIALLLWTFNRTETQTPPCPNNLNDSKLKKFHWYPSQQQLSPFFSSLLLLYFYGMQHLTTKGLSNIFHQWPAEWDALAKIHDHLCLHFQYQWLNQQFDAYEQQIWQSH